MKIAISTDGNSGFTHAEAEKLGITIIPTPVIIDGEIYLEDISLTQDFFYEKLTGNSQNLHLSAEPRFLAGILGQAA